MNLRWLRQLFRRKERVTYCPRLIDKAGVYCLYKGKKHYFAKRSSGQYMKFKAFEAEGGVPES